MRPLLIRCVLLALCLTGSVTPCGGAVAYTALVGGVWRIHWQDSLEGEPHAVADDLGSDAGAPSLSAAGSEVAFEVAGRELGVCPLRGAGGCKTVEPAPGWAARPTWEPKSGELVFVHYTADAGGEDSEIVITRAGLTGIGPLLAHTGNQDDPDLSPDGRSLAYSSAQTVSLQRAGVRIVRQLWMMDLATGEASALAADSSQDIHPDWSPDGRRLAFASDRTGNFEIWVVERDGSGLRQVTSGPGSKTWPAWSPEGDEILYAVSREGRQGLAIVSADGSKTRSFEPFGAQSSIELRDPDWR